MLRQVVAVAALNLSSLPSRRGASLVIVVGIGGVVAVLLGLLAMSNGFRTSLVEAAHADRLLIVRGDSNNEMSGWVTNEQLGIIESDPGLAVTSGEIVVAIVLNERGTDMEVDVPGRGVTAPAFDLRDEVRIVRGRAFRPGTSEVIVGVRAADRYQGLDLGDHVEARTTTWTVVGHFVAGGSAVESEIWLDRSVGQDVYRRSGGVSVVRVRLAPGVSLTEVSERVRSDPRLGLAVIPETEFFREQTRNRAALIDTFAYFVAGIMAVGSVLAALNTMYVAVSRRTREIATLRAMGFSATSVVVSVMLEVMLLAAAGALVAAGLVYLLLDGYATATYNGASSTQVAFSFRVTPSLVLVGLGWALLLGFVAGLLPALRAARLPLTDAFRAG
ncbi:MAG: FtsX-like permease family protein [Pseudomonadales bacterium]